MIRFAASLLPLLIGIGPVAIAADTFDLSMGKQLLIDDHVVEQLSGAIRVVQQPKRVSVRPILAPEHPWEGSILQMPCVLWDQRKGVYHMYYWAAAGDSIFTCYARSTDGRRWEKPRLNLHAGPDGSKHNNIVLRGEGKVARTRYVVFNPRTDEPQRRFLALYIDNVPGLTEFAASSPDGLHWKTEKKIGDLRHVRGGRTTANPPFFLIEQQWAKDPRDGHRYRAIWRTESRDMLTWTGGRIVVERLPDDDPHLEFYHACSHFLGSQTYHGLHLGYLYLFHTDNKTGVRPDGVRLAGTVDTSLMVSRDTIRWTRLDRRRRFVPLGPEGSWDGKMNYVSPEVIVGDQMLFYYSGWRNDHGAKDNQAAIGLATLPLDRFVAVQPKEKSARLTTKPFLVKGDGLRVNADADKGELRIALLAENGDEIAGFGAAACEPIVRDELRAAVRWRGGKWQDLRGKKIRIRFQLDRAKLYSFEVH